ncbi:hypothetical protein KP509_24G070800 [Ceratopteris richardii]|nr:hypothetical protein KP509_24G070800 [Ceratopteris richardii]
MTGTYLGFEHCDVNLTPYNQNWQATRKALSLHLLSPSKIASQAPMRRRRICSVMAPLYCQASAEPRTVVNVSAIADRLLIDIIIRMMFGERYSAAEIQRHRRGSEALTIRKCLQEFDVDLREGIFLWGELNLAEYFPLLSWLDVQGLERRFRNLRKKLESLFQLIIQDHRQHACAEDEAEPDFIDVLLSQKQLTDKQLMGIMSNVLIAGIDTTARAIEWAMAELGSNASVIERAQEELDRVVGRNRVMDEHDIEKLPYLRAISKEVLRLHPSAPMDDPHVNEKPSTLGGYYIPAHSIILHNLWALSQDGSLWDNPTEFSPERFLKSKEYESMNVYGGDFKLLPFSSGRRRCPAYHFATLTLQHVVGVFLHLFDWSVPQNGAINMEESDGIVVGLKHPLMLSITPRLSNVNIK